MKYKLTPEQIKKKIDKLMNKKIKELNKLSSKVIPKGLKFIGLKEFLLLDKEKEDE